MWDLEGDLELDMEEGDTEEGDMEGEGQLSLDPTSVFMTGVIFGLTSP